MRKCFLSFLLPLSLLAAGKGSTEGYTGITQVETRADGKVAIYHDSGISTVDSATLPKEFLDSWGVKQIIIEPLSKGGVLMDCYIPDLNIEPIGNIKNLFGDIKRAEFETDQDYQKRIAALEPKEITFLVNLGHRVDFDSRTGIATVKSGGYQIKGDIFVVAVSLEKTLDVNTDFVNKLGIKVEGASESYGTIVLNVPMSRAGRMKDYFDPTQLTGLDEKYRKLTPYLFHEDYGSGALKFYGEYDNLLDADKWAFQFSYNTKLNSGYSVRRSVGSDHRQN